MADHVLSPPTRRRGLLFPSMLAVGFVMLMLNSRALTVIHLQVRQQVALESSLSVVPGGPKEAKTQPEGRHKLAGLDCTKHGGPPNDIAAEMVYWSDIPSDSTYRSPFYSPDKYLIFERDRAGWNNARMGMETVFALAVAMGRTLVLPPEQEIPHLEEDEGAKGKQRSVFSFSDFYDLESVAAEHDGVNIITMEEFLKREAMTGKLRDKETGQILFPPGNVTNWNDMPPLKLAGYLEQVVESSEKWKPRRCIAVFPASRDPRDIEALKDLRSKIVGGGWDPKFMGPDAYEEFIGKPTSVSASLKERLKESWAQRETLCIYDQEMQEAPLVYFGITPRLLAHFYAFVFFQDWRHELWMKRFMRDHVRYVDQLECAAARVVHAVRERARKRNPASNGEFDTFHIRRGDLEFEEAWVEADEIYSVSKDELTPNSTVYVATDERNLTYFEPLAKHYDLVYLDDFKHLVEDLNSNFYGILEQLIASRGRIFFGCWYSTFTGHILRLRGYHAAKDKLPGYKDGRLPTTYFYNYDEYKKYTHEYYPLSKPFFEIQFPTAWRGVDMGVGETLTSK